jgi:hypothetical protein
MRVRCKRHDLASGPEGLCVLCRHERLRPGSAALAAPAQIKAARKLLLGLILLLGVSLAWHWLQGESFSLLRASAVAANSPSASA